MLKNQKNKDSLYIIFDKLYNIFPFVVLVIGALTVNAELIYLKALPVVLMISYIVIVFLDGYLKLHYNIEANKYAELLMFQKCSTNEELEALKLDINNIESKVIRDILLYKLTEIKDKIIEENEEDEDFNRKIEEAKDLLNNITDKELKRKLEDALDLKVKVHFDKSLKNSIFVEI